MTKEEIISKFIKDWGRNYKMDSELWRALVIWLEENLSG